MPQRVAGSGFTPLANWYKVRLWWVAYPSWLVSALFHLCLASLLFTISQWESCRGDYGGSQGDGFRAVGLRNRPAGEDSAPGTSTPGNSPTPAAHPIENAATPATTVASIVTSEPPVPLELPSTKRNTASILGPGPPPLASSGLALDDLVRPLTPTSPGTAGTGGGGTGGTGPGGGGGGTSFVGVQDIGQRFVYVIDRSASMDEHGSLIAARQELLTSIERLDESQEFQVIFYNNTPFPLQPRDTTFEMFRGTDAQRRQVRNQIAAVFADGGTRHFPALQMALQLDPDVIFLLTDGTSDSRLSSREMEDLKRLNRNGTRIHCIEFGTSHRPMLVGNFLVQLATQHGGQHMYRDVTALRSSVK